jgi:competence protein ComEA
LKILWPPDFIRIPLRSSAKNTKTGQLSQTTDGVRLSSKARGEMTMRSAAGSSVFAIALLCGLSACTTNQNPQQLKENTARATAELKTDAKAVAAGVREGWSRDKPLDINSATREQLTSLPSVTDAEADSVISGRPYDDPAQLVTRHILSKSKYDTIADRLKAK